MGELWLAGALRAALGSSGPWWLRLMSDFLALTGQRRGGQCLGCGPHFPMSWLLWVRLSSAWAVGSFRLLALGMVTAGLPRSLLGNVLTTIS